MTQNDEVIVRLEQYAKAIARKILQKFNLAHDEHRHEDITQSLFLQGCQVLHDTDDEAKAKHRMSSRAVNESKKLVRELKQPQPISNFDLSGDSDDGDYDDDEIVELQYRRVTRGPIVRSSPLEDMIAKEDVESLSERQQKIVRGLMASKNQPEIAKELNISTRTVERELENIRKDYLDANA